MNSGSEYFLAISDLTDVGISRALPLALASSVFPMLRLITRLAVRSARSADRARTQRFHVPQPSPDDLGSLYTPAVRMFASGYDTASEPDCLPFGPSLNQSLWLANIYDACERSFSFNHVIRF